MKHFICIYNFEDTGDAENGPGSLEPQDSFVSDAESIFDAEYYVENICFSGVEKLYDVAEISEEVFQEIKAQDEATEINEKSLVEGVSK